MPLSLCSYPGPLLPPGSSPAVPLPEPLSSIVPLSAVPTPVLASSPLPLAQLADWPDFLPQSPWWLLTLLFLPLVLLAWRRRVFPTARWLVPIGISLLLSVMTVFSPPLAAVVLVVDGVMLVVLVADLVWLLRCTSRGLSAQRTLPRTASLGVELRSSLTIVNQSPYRLVGQVRDDLPDGFTSMPAEHDLELPPRNQVTLSRRLVPGQRGGFDLQQADLRLLSPLRLWARLVRLPVTSRLNVYPNMKQLGDYALLAKTNRLSQIGVRRTRRVGQDSEFERLRDYTRDDTYRHIDWRSTARRGKLTVRQFQSDQSQRIVFMLDCGRMMTNQRDGYTLLDHALNSMLMMSYVALAQGDEVGLLCFSDSIHAYLPPRGGSSQMNRLLQAGFDQFPRMVESRYDDAFLYLANHCKRRTLVVLATSVIDEVNARQISGHLANIAGRHLPLGVLLRDRQIFDAAEASHDSPQQLYTAAAAADILLWRHQQIRDLQHQGVLVVDSFPEGLTAPLVNQYLKIKAQHLL